MQLALNDTSVQAYACEDITRKYLMCNATVVDTIKSEIIISSQISVHSCVITSNPNLTQAKLETRVHRESDASLI